MKLLRLAEDRCGVLRKVLQAIKKVRFLKPPPAQNTLCLGEPRASLLGPGLSHTVP